MLLCMYIRHKVIQINYKPVNLYKIYIFYSYTKFSKKKFKCCVPNK